MMYDMPSPMQLGFEALCERLAWYSLSVRMTTVATCKPVIPAFAFTCCASLQGTTAEVYLHGAHITSFKPAGREVCVLSPTQCACCMCCSACGWSLRHAACST